VAATIHAPWAISVSVPPGSLQPFLFLYFLKTFFIEIYFWFHNLQFYTPTARQGAAAGTYM